MLTPKTLLDQNRARPTQDSTGSITRVAIPVRLSLGLLLAMALPVFAQDGLDFGSGSIGSVVEQQVEEQVQEQVEEEVSEQIEEKIEELGFGSSAQRIEQKIEEQIEDSVENIIDDAVDEVIAGNIEDDIEQNVEETIEAEIDQNIEETIEDKVAQNIEEGIEDNIEETVAANIEEDVEESVAQTVEENLEISLEQDIEQEVDADVDQTVTAAVEDRLESKIDDVIERLENDLEIDEGRIHKDQWLVMAEPKVFEELARDGYLFDNITALPGLGMLLADVAAPSSFDISQARQGVIDVVGHGRAEVDLNHIYTAGTLAAASESNGIAPRAAINVPNDIRDMPLHIGMIDSEVDFSHPSLNTARIESRSFVTEDAATPDFHGTAVASIIAANTADYSGLAPSTKLYAASVFETNQQQGEIASTISLVRALDWLLSSGVEVINISLAGPPNRLLEAALKRASEQDVLIVAAAGNGGPAAAPMYPAAYSSVIAVTAVDRTGKVFRLANRGNYLDLAAPGVDLLHARAGGGYTASSGTSFAVPFAATAAARLKRLHPGRDIHELLYASAKDLGPPGRDDIYGYGLLRLGPP